MKISFRSKLILSYILLIFFSLSFVAFYLDKNLQEQALEEIKASLVNEAKLVEYNIAASLSGSLNQERLYQLYHDLASRVNSRFTVIDLDGRVVADSEKDPQSVAKMENHLSRPEVYQALQRGMGQEIRYSSTLKIDMLYVAVLIKQGNVNIGVLRLALPLTSVQKVLSAVRRTILVSLFFTLGLAFLLGSVLAQTIIRPLNRIIYTSKKFAQGDFKRRIFYLATDEVGQLATTLNKMAQDIEEKMREIDTKSQHLEAVFNSMVEGVIVTDASEKIISINHAIEGLFQVSREQAQGGFILEGIRNSEISGLINEALKKAEFISREVVLVLPEFRIVQVNVSPVFEKNEVTGSVAVIHDITQLRHLEKIRQDFVANISHELKTPLTSIKGFVETLLDGALEDKANSLDFLKTIDNHVNRLNALIDDLLELAHLESQEIALNKTRFNLAALVNQIVLGFKAQAKNRNLTISLKLPPDLEIFADRNKIEQVFSNLIHNAVKYNKENGSVLIYSELFEAKLKITIEDSGVGIPLKDIPRIFERFYRVDKARSRQLGGTGLGLSIVKHIIELHGGQVGVESTEGLGSKFSLIIPL
mgnify:CR=1 FL=1